MATVFDTQLKDFQALTLTELNSQASFLKRIDKKFLLTKNQLSEILQDLQKDFQVLEIAGKKVFSYDNIYMDTKNYLFYNQHQDKFKTRTKIRTRLYKDSDMAFFEFKQKINGVTQKFRYQFPSEEHGIMTKWKKRFFEWVWQSMYQGTPDAPHIFPAMQTKYKRITLVEKEWTERLTIDFSMKTLDLRDEDSKTVSFKNVVIIESKSLWENCKSWKIMEKYNIPEAKSCSKYALGIVYAGIAKKHDTFQNTIEKMEEIKKEIKK